MSSRTPCHRASEAAAPDDRPQTSEALELDMPVEVAFEKLDDEITLPLFRPARR